MSGFYPNCEKCGARCWRGRTICAKCRGPLPHKSKKVVRANNLITDTSFYRDLYTPETLKALEELEADQFRKRVLGEGEA